LNRFKKNDVSSLSKKQNQIPSTFFLKTSKLPQILFSVAQRMKAKFERFQKKILLLLLGSSLFVFSIVFGYGYCLQLTTKKRFCFFYCFRLRLLLTTHNKKTVLYFSIVSGYSYCLQLTTKNGFVFFYFIFMGVNPFDSAALGRLIERWLIRVS